MTLLEINPVGSTVYSVSDFPQLEFSMKEVQRAGQALKDNLLWTKETEADIDHIFRVANNWRDSHAFPMRSIRQSVISRLKHLEIDGITAARLKRMRSIRRKLRTIDANLRQIQDLGGCRVVLPSMADVKKLLENLIERPPHRIQNVKDYITDPKSDGYRCFHMVYEFFGQGEKEVFNGRRIELQVRTRLQHAWATAVEAVGLLRRENMKAGEGDSDWLRLFQLMSAELALAEGCPEGNLATPRNHRIEELNHLNKKLEAVETLENLRWAVIDAAPLADSEAKPEYYRIEYNNETNQVEVTPHFSPKRGILDYEQAERQDNLSGEDRINTVFVEADKVRDLKSAYPNYFGDVLLFNTNLRMAAEGLETKEFVMKPEYRLPKQPVEAADMSWFRPSKHRQWTYPSRREKPKNK